MPQYSRAKDRGEHFKSYAEGKKKTTLLSVRLKEADEKLYYETGIRA